MEPISSEPIIKLEKVTVAQPENVVLTNIDFELKVGEFIFLIGRTGSGKSTLLKTLYADLPLFKGEGIVAGFDLQKLKNRQIPFLRRKLGIIFQDFQLLTDRSVYENLYFVLKATGWKKKKEMENRIQQVLESVGLQHKEYKMPHELSGGEQQRVVIARSLLNNPEIILADEPTGNLDPESSSGIIKLLLEISKNGQAVIVATHDYPLLKEFPARTVKCENGGLIELDQVQQEVIDFDSLS
ncbi:MAG: ATP-binding cassette domain-containing protein [Salinivirgaceae bacterium]